MVQILPPKYNIGTQVGQSLGQGLQAGMQQGIQRGLLQQALGKVKDLSQNKDIKPIDLMVQLMEAGAGIPGSEKYLSTLLPLLMGQAQTRALYGQEGGAPPQEGSTGTSAPIAPGQTSPENAISAAGQTGLGVGLNAPQSPQLGGFLPREMTVKEMTDYAKNYALQSGGGPQAFDVGMQQARNINAESQAANAKIADMALRSGHVTQEELPEYMQLATRYGHLDNPNEIITSTNRDFARLRNLKKSLDTALFPGVTRGALQKGLGGFLGKLLAGGNTREEALKKLQPTIKDLVELGYEPLVRQKLASEQLSKTEIEEAIHPLSEKTFKSLEAFPNASRIPNDIKQKKLSEFFKNNVDPDTSLLVLRHKLWNDKGYDWQEIGPAISEAENAGLKLTDAQKAERAELETQPPRQSLIDIFSGDWGRWLDYLRGNK